MLPTHFMVMIFRIHQGLSEGAGHEVQDHPRSPRRHSGPCWRPDLSAVLHLQGIYRDPQRPRGGRYIRWAGTLVTQGRCILQLHTGLFLLLSFIRVLLPQERTIYSESPLTCMFFLGSPVLMSERWPTVICTRSVARTCWRCCFNF